MKSLFCPMLVTTDWKQKWQVFLKSSALTFLEDQI